MGDPLGIEVRALAAPLLDDYLNFFDTIAFADNPRWAGCYCFFPLHDPVEKQWAGRTAEENRAAIAERILDGRAVGYLAYAGGEVVGWCSAGPQQAYPLLRGLAGRGGDEAGAIACFVIAPPFRGRGVATALLDAVCNDLRARGLKIVRARPRRRAHTAADNHYGPLAMYLAAGFTVRREDDDGHVLVQKALDSDRGGDCAAASLDP